MNDDERQFNYEMALHGIATSCLKALENETEDWPSWWRPFKRARWQAKWDALFSLGMAAREHEAAQHEAYPRAVPKS